jgi:ribosomal protein S18 acetylase RimI-like enzyme
MHETFSFSAPGSSTQKEFTSRNGHKILLSWIDHNTSHLLLDETQRLLYRIFLKTYQADFKEDYQIGDYFSKKKSLKAFSKKEFSNLRNPKTLLRLLIASHGRRIIGALTFEPEEILGNALYIRQLGVLPNYCGEGIARRMIEQIKVDNPLISSIVLVSRMNNNDAEKFYVSLDFQKSGYTHPDYSLETYVGFQKDY